MLDIHSHILPGVDDGSKSMEMTKNILSRYVEEGISAVMCTPHQSAQLRRSAVLRERFALFKEEVSSYPIDFYLGSEIYYYDGMLADLKSGELLTLNDTSYVLVEFSTRAELANIPDAVYELSLAGYKPIVAHVERYDYLEKSSYDEIISNGGMLQVNCSSFGKKEHLGLLKRLLKRDMISFIASDAHSDGRRNVDFSAARKFIAKKFPALVQKFFGDNNIFASQT